MWPGGGGIVATGDQGGDLCQRPAACEDVGEPDGGPIDGLQGLLKVPVGL